MKFGGFYRGNSVHERIWKGKSKAEFTVLVNSAANAPGRGGVFHLITMRSSNRFDTTI